MAITHHTSYNDGNIDNDVEFLSRYMSMFVDIV